MKNFVNSDDEKDAERFLADMFCLKKSRVLNAAKLAGLNIRSQNMPVSEATHRCHFYVFLTKKMRELRTLLQNINIGNFIPSEDKIRKEQEKLLGHLNGSNTEFGTT